MTVGSLEGCFGRSLGRSTNFDLLCVAASHLSSMNGRCRSCGGGAAVDGRAEAAVGRRKVCLHGLASSCYCGYGVSQFREVDYRLRY